MSHTTSVFDGLTRQMSDRLISGPLRDAARTNRWQAGFRHGAGLAIAALARCSGAGDRGEFDSAAYLRVAQEAFAHLEAHNLEYLWDGAESVVDDYAALLAASELVIAETGAGASPDRSGLDAASQSAGRRTPGENGEPGHPAGASPALSHLAAALRRASQLIARYVPGDGGSPGHLIGDAAGRPFFHAVESGLPVLALLRFAQAAPGDDLARQARTTALAIMRDWATRTDAVPNPCGYPRALMQATGATPQERFFFPHDNETGYRWQGENANLASIAAAALASLRLPECDPALAVRLRRLAADALHWISGCNPFDFAMVQGLHHDVPEDEPAMPNVPGGICNGITAGVDDEDDIAFLPAEAVAQGDAWRWSEQWIPHGGWFVLAGSMWVANNV
jgi:hypothetical protein